MPSNLKEQQESIRTNRLNEDSSEESLDKEEIYPVSISKGVKVKSKEGTKFKERPRVKSREGTATIK